MFWTNLFNEFFTTNFLMNVSTNFDFSEDYFLTYNLLTFATFDLVFWMIFVKQAQGDGRTKSLTNGLEWKKILVTRSVCPKRVATQLTTVSSATSNTILQRKDNFPFTLLLLCNFLSVSLF